MTESRTIEEGGLTALLVKRQLNPAGLALVAGGVTLYNAGKGGIDAHSRAKMGRISYDSGMARMTNSFPTGAVEAMKDASGGNYSAFADMAKNVVSRPGPINQLQDHGATPDMIAALYHMGGR